MKILLINPPSPFLIDDAVFPSLGLLYLSAYLKNNGFADVEILDLDGGKPLPTKIDKDIIGFYSNTPQFPSVMWLFEHFNNINTNKKAIYIIGGPHVSGKPEDAFNVFDAIVVGEGERAILEIIKLYSAGHRFKHDVIKQHYIENIDEISFPDRDAIDLKRYHYYLNEKLTTTIITSRGCPFACKFCANNVWGKTLRFRSPHNVVEEIKLLISKYEYRSFMFFDDTMTVNKKRMAEICKGLEDLDIVYRCFIRSDTVDREILQKMRSSGCIEVGMGIESGSQRILNIVNKSETVEQNMKAVRLCHDAGIRVKGFFIIGLPGESKESINETIKFLEETDLYDIDITIYQPYPGSYIYKNKKDFDINFEDDYGHAWFKGRRGNYSTTTSTKTFGSDEILRLRDEIENRFKKRN